MTTQNETAGNVLTMLDHLTDAITLFDEYVNSLTLEERCRLSSEGIWRDSFVRNILKLWRINEQLDSDCIETKKTDTPDSDRHAQIISTAQGIVDMASEDCTGLSAELYRFVLSYYAKLTQS